MSLWDNTPNTLTSFTPLSSDVQPAGGFLSRLFRRNKDDSDQSRSESTQSSREVSVERETQREKSLEGSPIRRGSVSSSSVKDRDQDDSESSQSDVRSEGIEREQNEELPLNQASKRTLRSVITSLSNILDRRASTPQVYRDSDFKQYWMPDRSCRECYDCGDKFSTFRRRHHCRVCGQIFCNACCNQELPGRIIGFKGSIRVCTYCCHVVQKYAQKVDPLADPRVTKEALHKAFLDTDLVTSPDGAGQRRSTLDLQGPLSLRSPGDPETTPSQEGIAPFDLTPQSDFVPLDNFTNERRLLIQDSVQLRTLWSLMIDPERGVEVQSYRIRLRTYQKCIMGNKLVDWLLKQDKVATRVQAIAVGQALIDADYLEPIGSISTPFRDDFTLYKPTEMSMSDTQIISEPDLEDFHETDSAPQWFQDIDSNIGDDESISEEQTLRALLDSVSINLDNAEVSTSNLVQLGTKEPLQQETDEPLPQQNSMGTEDLLPGTMFQNPKSYSDPEPITSWRVLDHLGDNTEEKTAYTQLQHANHDHLTLLTKQLLSDDSLPPSWADIIIATVDRVSLFVKPDVKESGDDMDIRHYVHIKKVPGGNREQTGLVHGVIFTKNVAHKKMAQLINNPRTLLLNGSIEYQRVEQKMSSLQPQILQEEEFLRKSIAKIVALKPKPHIVIVEKSVSRLAQHFLLHNGITLIYNVKLSVMGRLARFLCADIVPSIDSLVGGPMLGFCHSFSSKCFTLPTGDQKNMLIFDGCATHLGCAVTLRGGSQKELKRVKKIMNFMIYASYHSRLEISFCMDEFMLSPAVDDELHLDWEINKNGVQKGATQSKVGTLKLCDNKEKEHPPSTGGEARVTEIPEIQVSTTETDRREINIEEVVSVSKNTKDGRSDCHTKTGEAATSFIANVTQSTGLSASKGKSKGGHSMQSSGPKQEVAEVSVTLDQQVADIINAEEVIPSESPKADKKLNVLPKQGASCDNTTAEIQTANETSQSDTRIPSASNKSGQSTNSLQNQTDIAENVLRKSSNSKRLSSNRESTEISKDRLNKRRDSEMTQLTDHSDPLHNYQKSQDESIFHSTLALMEQRQTSSHKLRKALESIILSSSLFVQFELPYLESEKGLKCELRRYFPEEIYWTAHFSPKERVSRYNEHEQGKKLKPTNIEILDAHELIRCTLNEPLSGKAVQTKLAEYRAYGGRINVLNHNSSSQFNGFQKQDDQSSKKKEKEKQSSRGRQLSGEGMPAKEISTDTTVMWERKIDCLDPYKHQRIAVLFSSYSYHSNNHPSPCVFPWMVTMDFYGRNDITLGGFLERFCFRESYLCPSGTCETPMVQHIRRFVHGKGSISVVMKLLDAPIVNAENSMLLWSWCHKCRQVTPVVPISTDTWNMSFAKYLEIRFHGNQSRSRASAAPCDHSLHHDHFQYFGYRDKVASFKYAAIKLKEIKLPPLEIKCVPQVEQIHLYRLRDEVKRLINRATDVYSTVLDCVCKMKAETPCEVLSKQITSCVAQQQHDKTEIRERALKLREKLETLICKEDSKLIDLSSEQNKTYNEALDSLVTLKKDISDAITCWNAKLQELYVQQKKYKQSTSQKKEKEKDTIPVVGSVEKLDTDDKGLQAYVPKSQEPTEDVAVSPPLSTIFSLDSIDGSMASCEENLALSEPVGSLRDSPLSGDMYTLSCDSFVYGVTPGISAAGVWPPALRQSVLSTDSSYIVCNLKNVTQTRGQQKGGDLETDQDVESVSNDPQSDLAEPQPVEDGAQTSSQEHQHPKVIISGQGQCQNMRAEAQTGESMQAFPVATKPTEAQGKVTQPQSTSSVEAQDKPKEAHSQKMEAQREKLKEQDEAQGVKGGSTDEETLPVQTRTNELEPQSTSNSHRKPEEAQAPTVEAQLVPVEATQTWADTSEGTDMVFEENTFAKTDVVSVVDKPDGIDTGKKEELTESVGGDKISTIRKTLMSTLWQGSVAFQIQSPFDPHEHHQLTPSEWVPVVVYDYEPSSIIAYSLSCPDYRTKLHEVQANLNSVKDTGPIQQTKSSKTESEPVVQVTSKEDEFLDGIKRPTTGKLSASRKDDTGKKTEMLDSVRYKVPKPDVEDIAHSQDEVDGFSIFTTSMAESEKSKLGKQSVNSHIELQFSDSTARFYCKAYYAEQFRHLRKLIFPDGEDVYIRSLSHCKKWEAKGGKSGSAFCKTDDDRFVLKQMSSMEVESFEKFGPHYFQYISKSQTEQRPSALAKIVGVYRIGFRNQLTNQAMKQDVLVMENLFYNRQISQTFDLKGSMRNRLVNPDRKGKEELVLLDENFLRVSVDCPLYIRPHSKTMLTLAISHDSQFLSSNLVMDYSLLVGVDEQKKELVVGIIDYIRTFTWDKKLETVFKSMPGRQLPTVVSPEVYRNRFLDAMRKYFLPVPDQWSGLGRDVDN